MSETVTNAANIVPADSSDPRRYAGHLFDWKLQGAQTGGAFSLVEIHGWQGGEPPVHYHEREDEIFYVLEGEVTFMVGDEIKRGGPGMSVWAPRMLKHGFAFETPTVRLLTGFLPSGQEDVFHAFSTPDPARRAPAEPAESELPDFAAIEAMDREAGVVYLGPPLRELLAGA